MKLIYEYQEPEIHIEESVNENKVPVKKYKIKGIFSTIGEKNRNGRIYPKDIWEKNVSEYQNTIKSGSINRLCEWQHPERTNVDMMEAVAAIDKLWIEDNKVMGEATLLDNPKANQIKTLIDNGIKISVSSRGVGSVRNGIVEDFKLITYDLVDCPSDYNATMEGFSVTESTKNFEILEDGRIIETFEDVKHSEEDIKEAQDRILKAFDNFFNSMK